MREQSVDIIPQRERESSVISLVIKISRIHKELHGRDFQRLRRVGRRAFPPLLTSSTSSSPPSGRCRIALAFARWGFSIKAWRKTLDARAKKTLPLLLLLPLHFTPFHSCRRAMEPFTVALLVATGLVALNIVTAVIIEKKRHKEEEEEIKANVLEVERQRRKSAENKEKVD
ncbi:uncharacterized protein LOC143035825 [Oratosquilla oratoria]|uniref:uncharacterized protein LOC143035825 n=1 Tax=Oratosquilla oratoria TaxID=337810 RepID=UPI003F764C6B